MNPGTIILMVAVPILLAGCGDNTAGIITPVLPHDPVDAAWKAVENLEYAINTLDLNLVEATLDPDFFHHLHEDDWADFNGDGIIDEGWDLDLELTWYENLFEEADEIYMTFTGSEEYTWEEDPTGMSLALPRTFDVKIYFPGGQYGIQTSGEVIFVCRPDSTDEWRITHQFSLQPVYWF